MVATLLPLRLARLSRGKTQYEVARVAGVPASRLSLLERGHDEPSPRERESLAAALGVPAHVLFPPSVPTTPPSPTPAAHVPVPSDTYADPRS